jgi:anaerobic selenocysteine-containing dehydrogenase
MREIKRGDKVVVETLSGEVHGQVVSVRMSPPDFIRPMAVCVLIPGRANTTIYPANKVRRVSA